MSQAQASIIRHLLPVLQQFSRTSPDILTSCGSCRIRILISSSALGVAVLPRALYWQDCKLEALTDLIRPIIRKVTGRFCALFIFAFSQKASRTIYVVKNDYIAEEIDIAHGMGLVFMGSQNVGQVGIDSVSEKLKLASICLMLKELESLGNEFGVISASLPQNQAIMTEGLVVLLLSRVRYV